eukprot:scaffold445713_cov45-Prasinocladus_malaysianus.AAC.1
MKRKGGTDVSSGTHVLEVLLAPVLLIDQELCQQALAGAHHNVPASPTVNHYHQLDVIKAEEMN